MKTAVTKRKRLTRRMKDILLILYADDDQKPVKSTHLPWMLKYLDYLRGKKR